MTRQERWWGSLWLLYCGLIYYLSDQSTIPVQSLFEHQDKLMHGGAYALMAALLFLACRQRFVDQPWLRMMVVVAVCSLYGVSDEWHQSFVVGRDSSVGDWLADTAGAALMIGFIQFLDSKKKRRNVRHPLSG